MYRVCWPLESNGFGMKEKERKPPGAYSEIIYRHVRPQLEVRESSVWPLMRSTRREIAVQTISLPRPMVKV